MHTLLQMLQDSDAAMLPILAQRWGVSVSKKTKGDALIEALAAAMLDPAGAEKMYDSLNDKERGVLQTLLGSGKRMAMPLFSRLYGEVRKMGAGAIEREKPHENPVSSAESLFYKGLIGQRNDKVGGGLGPVIYVPDDLAAILPIHKTGYNAAVLDAEAEKDRAAAPATSTAPAAGNGTRSKSAPPAAPMPDESDDFGETFVIDNLEDADNPRQADTSIVDDMTTLLAYLQLHSGAVDPETGLDDATRDAVLPHMLVADDNRLDFLLEIGLSADLIELQNAKAYPKRAEVRRWLSEKRSSQLKWLTEAWRGSIIYRDLWHTPGLHPEPTGWPYDPVVARQAMLEFLTDLAPKQGWWSVMDFVDAVKEVEPDFQRPGGDYDSWYIRNNADEYLNGFESWDAVEGALLEFYIFGPMHWLGLADVGEDAARLTVYGRTLVDPTQQWPSPPDPEEKVIVHPDGTLLASRKVPRLDRFQLARFTTWEEPGTLAGDHYVYKLDAAGVQRAAAQGINTGHIASFIGRMLENPNAIPAPIARLLENWRGGAASSVSMEQLLVLRTTAPETLDFIFNAPALRRFLGARLGPMAAAVRQDQWEALQAALGEQGIAVELIG